jgi:hypothetical protein
MVESVNSDGGSGGSAGIEGQGSSTSGTASLNLTLPTGSVTASAAAYSVVGPVTAADGSVVSGSGSGQTVGIFLYDPAASKDIVFEIVLSVPNAAETTVPLGTIPVVPVSTWNGMTWTPVLPTSLSATLRGSLANGSPIWATSGSVTITQSSADTSSGPGHIQGTFTGTIPDSMVDGGTGTIPVSGSFDAVENM